MVNIDYEAALLDDFMSGHLQLESTPNAFAVLTVDEGAIIIWDYFGSHGDIVENASRQLVSKGFLRLKMFGKPGDVGDKIPAYLAVFLHSVYSVTSPTVDILGG